ncbi:winged helix-turn-helix domain-containing protein [Micromonospora sp. NPDC020750]|uniref:winged helix-turn-helix domain-containing protein n=1 Tax=unclassified Micromonospora TaxID=2617518 RepID=UPI0037B0523C
MISVDVFGHGWPPPSTVGAQNRDVVYPEPRSSTQLAALLRNQILAGQLPAGSRFPSDRWLCETHDVGRSMVRAAIAILRTEGLVVTRQGQTTRVRGIHPKRPVDMTGVVWVETRMPTAPERESMPDSPDEGVPVLVVWRAGVDKPVLLPGDRWVIPGPAGRGSDS